MKIAIIGSGISGIGAAWYLGAQHDVSVFEANDYLGGHTATIDTHYQGQDYAIDTGFIVFNNRTYPNYLKFLDELGIGKQETEMSFSVSNQMLGLEYNGHSIASLFAQKRNYLNPKFYYLLAEIVRFNKLAKQHAGKHQNALTLGEFLSQNKFGDYFAENYILPMGAAIWSSTLVDMRQFPLQFFLNFFLNHGLLDLQNRPQWYVVPGGSRQYVRAFAKQTQANLLLRHKVVQVKRQAHGVELCYLDDKQQAQQQTFDQVIFACHSDQALALLDQPQPKEQELLGAMRYQENEVVLHCDDSLLPNSKKAWAAWNYKLYSQHNNSDAAVSLTYNMNILQGIKAPTTFCVSLNQTQRIDQDKVLGRYFYSHPIFDLAAIEAQKQRHLINGVDRIWYCGAYWRNGFHEDGLSTALDVVEGINSLPQGELKHG